MKASNIGEFDLIIRFALGIVLIGVAVAGSMDAPVGFDAGMHHWLVVGIVPLLGMLSFPLNIMILALSLFVLYTCATRFCLLYRITGIKFRGVV